MNKQEQADINNVVDYIIVKLVEGGVSLTVLKLQKLLFYVQAWSLAFGKGRAFRGDFQAWIHGPVNREVYDRFKDSHSLYSGVALADVRNGEAAEALPEAARLHIDEVIDSYGTLTGTQLEAMTHAEKPWKHARQGMRASERCERVIDEALMAEFYKAQLAELGQAGDSQSC